MLTDQRVTEFQALYKKHFGEDISTELALEYGTKMVQLMKITYQPMTHEEFAALQK